MPSEGADWRQRPERSNMFWLRVMTWISLKLGRGASRVVLYGIAAYFLAFAPTARRMSRRYLQRVLKLGSPGTSAGSDLFRHFLSFASVIHDRVYLINDRYDLFDIRIHNRALIDDLVADGRGAFLIGAHLGSFEVLRAVGRQRSRACASRWRCTRKTRARSTRRSTPSTRMHNRASLRSDISIR